MPERETRLHLSAGTLLRLLPHRRPFLMVDSVESYERAPRPSLRATRHISINEPVFDGHFPHLAMWPGVYTIEGLAQSCQLLGTIAGLERAFEMAGGDPGAVLSSLRELDRRLRKPLAAASDGDAASSLEARLVAGAATRMGLLAAVDVRLLQPVYAGQRLDYAVAEAALQPSETLIRYEVEATSGGQPVARGTLIATRGSSPAASPAGSTRGPGAP